MMMMVAVDLMNLLDLVVVENEFVQFHQALKRREVTDLVAWQFEHSHVATFLETVEISNAEFSDVQFHQSIVIGLGNYSSWLAKYLTQAIHELPFQVDSLIWARFPFGKWLSHP